VRAFWDQLQPNPGGTSWQNEVELVNAVRRGGLACAALFPSQPRAAGESAAVSWSRLADEGCPYLPVDALADGLGRWQSRIADAALLAAVRQEIADQGGSLDGSTEDEAPAAAELSPEKSRPPRTIGTAYATIYKAYLKQALNKVGDSDFVPLSATVAAPTSNDVALAAYYLPQYHPIAENDVWWGRGFTDWSNVAKAVPSYVGHYQPRLPGELGFYDLRVPEVMKRQAELARQHGISAFCFYAYWFGGRRLLERPLLAFLDDPGIDIQFFLCWANENWSRRWDGTENQLLISQSHSPEDDVAFIRYYRKYFDDPRQLKIDGKPVLMVYRPGILPSPSATIERWREEAVRSGLPGLYIVATTSFGFSDAARLGFDAIVEFPPHAPQRPAERVRVEIVNASAEPTTFSYESVVKNRVFEIGETADKVWPGVMAAFDNTARRATGAAIYNGCTPALFQQWLENAIQRARKNPAAERLVIINAWNEWAEGTYLEPDRRHGYAYLAACARALSNTQAIASENTAQGDAVV
jgi:lipopolysaccharide biosynthesis protein